MPRQKEPGSAHVRRPLLALFLGLLPLAATADDIEIFLGTSRRDEPRILLVADAGVSADVVESVLRRFSDTPGSSAEVWILPRDSAQPMRLQATAVPEVAGPPDAPADASLAATLHRALRALKTGASLFDGSAAGPAETQPGADVSCAQTVHVVLLTTGSRVTLESGATPGYGALPPYCDASEKTRPAAESGDQLSVCAKSLARQLAATDLRPDVPGHQGAVLHVLTLDAGEQSLEELARAGEGAFASVNEPEAVLRRIRDYVTYAWSVDQSLLAPTPAFADFQSLSHLEQLYVAMFRPEARPRWTGNLKRYRLRAGDAALVDADGRPAIEPETGLPAIDTRSFWSRRSDGSSVELGGAAGQARPAALRSIFSFFPESGEPRLNSPENRLSPVNPNLTPGLLGDGSMTDAERRDLLDWIRGHDVDDEDADGDSRENRFLIGDVLHSRPAVIPYGATADNPDLEVFFGSNAGVLHAIDGTTGRETFAFLPKELLPMQRLLRENPRGVPHPYGVDGSPTIWFRDEGRDGIRRTDAGDDFARVFFGLRRGGRSYYALDVTHRDDPRLLWSIHGGESSTLGDYRELGQSWSKPIRTRVRLAGDVAPRDVLIFSGGYDVAQDEALTRRADSVGRGMYIVDALTGEALWSGGRTGAQAWSQEFSEMDYSFPGGVSVLDTDADGLADLWFAGDTGGQIWRFDIVHGNPDHDLVRGQVVAKLGGEPAANRRFYSAPSIALMPGRDGLELALAVGSGFRPSPLLRETRDALFVLRQPLEADDPRNEPAQTRVLTESDLTEVGSAVDHSAGQPGAVLPADSPSPHGWYMPLEQRGEKVLSSPLIAGNRVFFTTYTPAEPGESCAPVAGLNRSYGLDLNDGGGSAPLVLRTASLIDQPRLLFAPLPDRTASQRGQPAAGEGSREESGCAGGQAIAVQLNLEQSSGVLWCNETERTYWVRE